MTSKEKYNNARTTYGRLMYNITNTLTKLLMKHMWLYWTLNFTWGIITTLLGWMMTVFTKIFLEKHINEIGKFGPCHYISIFENWGGLEMGVCFFLGNYPIDTMWGLHTRCHEIGHTFQNAIFGPLAIFIIYIPSAIRYWYQIIRERKGKQNSDYDSIWFEGSATNIGTDYYNNYINI